MLGITLASQSWKRRFWNVVRLPRWDLTQLKRFLGTYVLSVSDGQGWKGKIDDCSLRMRTQSFWRGSTALSRFRFYLRHGNIPFGLFRLAAGLKTAHSCWRHRRELGAPWQQWERCSQEIWRSSSWAVQARPILPVEAIVERLIHIVELFQWSRTPLLQQICHPYHLILSQTHRWLTAALFHCRGRAPGQMSSCMWTQIAHNSIHVH